jgi:hypothetical protein
MFAVRVVHAPATLLAVPPRAATVGFDSSLTHAVASYTFRAGSGPGVRVCWRRHLPCRSAVGRHLGNRARSPQVGDVEPAHPAFLQRLGAVAVAPVRLGRRVTKSYIRRRAHRTRGVGDLNPLPSSTGPEAA